MDHLKTGVIDIGNSNVKWGVFNSGTLESYGIWDESQHWEELLGTASRWIVASVRAELPVAGSDKVLYLNPGTRLPFINKYKTPQTLGQDRIAAVSGAMAIFPGFDCLVIDAGTCITYDFINRDKEYMGGAISPGLQMRFKALHEFTGKLPLVESRECTGLTGANTEECILSGVIQGMIGEIRHQVTYYRANSSNLKVLLTGGDAPFFENKLNLDIFAAPYLVLSGLNEILKYNPAPHV